MSPQHPRVHRPSHAPSAVIYGLEACRGEVTRVHRPWCAPSVGSVAHGVHRPSWLSSIVCAVRRVHRPSRIPSVAYTIRRVHRPSRSTEMAVVCTYEEAAVRRAHRPSAFEFTVRPPSSTPSVRLRVHRRSVCVYTVRPSSPTPSVIHIYSPLQSLSVATATVYPQLSSVLAFSSRPSLRSRVLASLRPPSAFTEPEATLSLAATAMSVATTCFRQKSKNVDQAQNVAVVQAKNLASS